MARKKKTEQDVSEGTPETHRGHETRMRSPWTAEKPDELGSAKWIPELRCLPDVSESDLGAVPDPLNYVKER